MENELSTIVHQYNYYPEAIQYDAKNPTVKSPYAPMDLQFNMTRETLQDVDLFRNFLKNAESRFRASLEYKAYKAKLMAMGLDRCQMMGNITSEDADIELHHNVLGLFDICLLITLHVINTIGMINSFQLIQMLIYEHNNDNVGVTFLSSTAHQLYTVDPEGYIPPDQTFGRWWELLSRYRYGITYDLANKVIKYVRKYQDKMPVSINIQHQEQILNYAIYNETSNYSYAECGTIPDEECYEITTEGGYSDYGY